MHFLKIGLRLLVLLEAVKKIEVGNDRGFLVVKYKYVENVQQLMVIFI